MEVKIKIVNSDAVIPSYAKPGDAGLDLTANWKKFEEDGTSSAITYGTGIAVEIPEGHVGLIYPRSSISKKNLYLVNSVGVIDSGYRGEILMKFRLEVDFSINGDEYVDAIDNAPLQVYEVGDKIGQLIIVPYPTIEFKEVEELSDTERGTGGFGHTGN